jgi:hypothetical protein
MQMGEIILSVVSHVNIYLCLVFTSLKITVHVYSLNTSVPKLIR